jgi:hypothetical protein
MARLRECPLQKQWGVREACVPRRRLIVLSVNGQIFVQHDLGGTTLRDRISVLLPEYAELDRSFRGGVQVNLSSST